MLSVDASVKTMLITDSYRCYKHMIHIVSSVCNKGLRKTMKRLHQYSIKHWSPIQSRPNKQHVPLPQAVLWSMTGWLFTCGEGMGGQPRGGPWGGGGGGGAVIYSCGGARVARTVIRGGRNLSGVWRGCPCKGWRRTGLEVLFSLSGGWFRGQHFGHGQDRMLQKACVGVLKHVILP